MRNNFNRRRMALRGEKVDTSSCASMKLGQVLPPKGIWSADPPPFADLTSTGWHRECPSLLEPVESCNWPRTTSHPPYVCPFTFVAVERFAGGGAGYAPVSQSLRENERDRAWVGVWVRER